MPRCDGDVAEAVAVHADNLHHRSADRSEGGAQKNHSDEKIPYTSTPKGVVTCHMYGLLVIKD